MGIFGHLSGTTYTDSGTYTFHVGPMADLEVRDAGANSGIPVGQRAFSIMAVNHGPGDAPSVEVKITGLSASDVQSHSATTGSFDPATGIWTIQNIYGRDGEVLSITPNSSAEDKKISASIRITRDYSVCIDSMGNDVSPKPADGTACQNAGGTWYEGPVYDYRADNDTATVKARRGAGKRPAEEAKPFVAVTWQAVDGVNGFPVSHYQVWRAGCDDQEPATMAAEDMVADDVTETGWVDLDVAAEQTYCYQVRAVNIAGVAGPFSRVMERTAREPLASTSSAPEAPVLTATPNEPNGDTQILLTWAKPVENGSAITAYTLEVSDTGRDGPWADTGATLGADAIAWTHEGLTAGTRQHYRIKATNAQGDSPWSEVVSVSTRVMGIPGAPENVQAAPDGGGAIDVSWDEPTLPADHDGWNITRYEVQWSADGVSRWRGAGNTSDGLTLTLKDSGLAFGETRHYRVAARNSRGLSNWSYPPYAMATTLAGVPGQPILKARAAASDIIELTWTAPTDNGSEITAYHIQWSEDGGTGRWNDLATVAGTIIGNEPNDLYDDAGLDPVTTRYYRIRAVNDAGPGTWSRTAKATTPVRTEKGVGPPDPPRNLKVAPGDGLIDASWERPANDGGSDITNYSVQFRSSGSWEDVPHDGAHTYTTIFEHSNGTLLTNGRRYYVRVAAINENGMRGSYAQGSAVPSIPESAPWEPRNVEPTGGHERIVVTWREPYHLGHPEVNGYMVQYRVENQDGTTGEWLPETPISALPTDRSATITGLENGLTTGLKNGTTYQVLVWAVNRVGDSPKAGADGALKATPVKASDGDEYPATNPRNLRLSPGVGQITATWSAPADRGDPAFTGYQVQYRCRWCGYDEWADWTTWTFGDEDFTTGTRATITGLDPEMDYQVQVKTVDNGYGSGLAIAQTTTR